MNKKMLLKLGIACSLMATVASADAYFGIKYGIASTDKSVYGNDSGEMQGPYIKYDDLSLIGVDFRGFANFDNHILFGGGFDLMTESGDFLQGGTLDMDLYVGAHFKDLKTYAIIGYGIQSLSDYTVATGAQYGIGATYDISNSFAISLDYKQNNLKTTDNDEYTANQEYKLSGFYLTAAYKF